MSVAVADHLLKAHKPAQTSEEVNIPLELRWVNRVVLRGRDVHPRLVRTLADSFGLLDNHSARERLPWNFRKLQAQASPRTSRW